MLTENRYYSSRHSSREGKPRYSSFIFAQNLNQSQYTEPIKQVRSFTPTDTPKKCEQPIVQYQTSIKKPASIRYKHNLNITNVATLTVMLIITVIVLLCNINLVFEADSRCWENFKQQKCDINNPQGNQCIQLHECISDPQFQISIELIIISLVSTMLAVRFRKKIKNLLVKLLELWEMVAWDQVEIDDQ